MYRSGDTYYTEEHSVSFGNVNLDNDTFSSKANTWTTWHLIPSSRIYIAHPNPVTKFVEIPGVDGQLDLSDYLTGGIVYGMRNGSMKFYIDNGHGNPETIRKRIAALLHGKKIKMVLADEPNYYYEGMFTVGTVEAGSSYSSITISYQLEPYKNKIASNGASRVVWDTFNFEEDYDYSYLAGEYRNNTWIPGITVGKASAGLEPYKEFPIYCDDFSFTPIATCTDGFVDVTFRNNKVISLTNGDIVSLPTAKKGKNLLTVKGAGTIFVSWREAVI